MSCEILCKNCGFQGNKSKIKKKTLRMMDVYKNRHCFIFPILNYNSH